MFPKIFLSSLLPTTDIASSTLNEVASVFLSLTQSKIRNQPVWFTDPETLATQFSLTSLV